MHVTEDTTIETKKNLGVSVGSVIAGSKEEIKREKARLRTRLWRLNPENLKKEKNRKSTKTYKDRSNFLKRKKRNENIEEFRKKEASRREKNRESLRESYSRNYYKHREKKLLKMKIYKIKNKEKINQRFYDKLKTDTNFRIRHYLRTRINKVLKLKNASKCKKSQELLGCTIEQLWQHLESQFQPGMTKENYGKWHIDHIVACANFDLTDPKQQAKCFHYTNLQPLWAVDNLKKGKKDEYIPLGQGPKDIS